MLHVTLAINNLLQDWEKDVYLLASQTVIGPILFWLLCPGVPGSARLPPIVVACLHNCNLLIQGTIYECY